MLVDSPVYPSFQMPNATSSFDDFFKMDLLSSDPSTSHPSSPGSPYRLATLPDPGPVMIASSDPDSFFNFFLEDDFYKDQMSTGVPMPILPSSSASGSAPYDFMGAFNSLSGSSSSASSNSPESPTSISSPHFAIDPMLVGTPATSKALSDFGEDEQESFKDDHEDDVDSGEVDMPLTTTPIKAGGRGKLRKGTVAGGGVVKKSISASGTTKEKENNSPKRNVISSVVATGPKADAGDAFDDWRPTPEEYKKMSSKEKRQLRNKISARNFRVRRKEYISTLEADISERDRLLSAIRTELGSTRSENNALRQEIASLKKALLEGRGVPSTPVLPPPAPLPATTVAPPTSAPAASSNIVIPNTLKDLPTSPRMSPRGFWGGVGALDGMGGFTPVHTALIPESSVGLGLSLSKKGLMENLNPALNLSTPQNLPQWTVSEKGKAESFEGFTDLNMFTLKTLDAYRMQLWTKMAAQHHQHQKLQQSQPLASPLQQPLHPSGVVANLRPIYFQHHAQNSGLSGLLSGKGTFSPKPLGNNTTTNIPSSPSLSAANQPTKEQAVMAAIASQTLLRRLGGAFWDAFSSGSSTSTPGLSLAPSPKLWDADKVRKVLEGTAVVRVVDVEPAVLSGPALLGITSVPSTSSPSPSSSLSSLSEKKEKCCSVLTDILAESMGGLNLGKK